MEYIAIKRLSTIEKKRLNDLKKGKSKFYLILREISFMKSPEYTASIVIQDGKINTIIYKDLYELAETQTLILGNYLSVRNGKDKFIIRVA